MPSWYSERRRPSRADRLEEELSALIAKNNQQVTSLRAELSNVSKERDKAAAPALVVAESQIRRLLQERDEVTAYMGRMKNRWEKVYSRLSTALVNAGMSQTEVLELFASAMDGEPKTITAGIQGAYTQSEEDRMRIRAIQRARGVRNGTDLADLIGDA